MKILSPKVIKPKKYNDPDSAFEAIKGIYEAQTKFLKDHFKDFGNGTIPEKRIRAFYPYIKLCTENASRADTRLAYGFVSRPGTYQTTITRPDIYGHYLKEQMRLLILNHDCPLEIGVSDELIPLHFALSDDFHLEKQLSDEQITLLPTIFDMPDLAAMDDEVPNNRFTPKAGEPEPLSLFKASRMDLSIKRLSHYCGTSAKHFQNYVIFTNYQFYIDEFVKTCQETMMASDNAEVKAERAEYTAFIEPGNKVTTNRNLSSPDLRDDEGTPISRMPQMPAYHLAREDNNGITMINIGVGPSNAKTITDHVAVLRPHAWLMLGHCAGLRNSQKLGDYVLAHAYLRQDHVLDRDLPPSVPIPALAEIQVSLAEAVATVTGLKGYDLKKIMRTGTVATVDDRNWELRPSIKNNVRLSQSRAIALEMESGTIAANGFRFRVPYGTLLCVSDKPFHGQPKLPGMADKFYRERVEQHLQVGILTMKLLREIGPDKLHSRKLRSFQEPAFQ